MPVFPIHYFHNHVIAPLVDTLLLTRIGLFAGLDILLLALTGWLTVTALND